MIEETLDIVTNDGEMETFICRPERGGPYPAIFFLMDAPGIREELRDMARRLATVGYHVLLPNLYYRDGGPSYDPWDPSALTPWMLPLAYALTNENVMNDTAKALAFINADPAAGDGAKAPAGAGPWRLRRRRRERRNRRSRDHGPSPP